MVREFHINLFIAGLVTVFKPSFFNNSLHGRSAFDRLVLSITPTDDGGGYVYVKVSATENLIVEDLDGELKPNVGSHGESQGDIEEGRGRGQGEAVGGKERTGPWRKGISGRI